MTESEQHTVTGTNLDLLPVVLRGCHVQAHVQFSRQNFVVLKLNSSKAKSETLVLKL